MGKFKVGDRVRALVSWGDVEKGEIRTVEHLDADGEVWLTRNSDGTFNDYFTEDELEHALTITPGTRYVTRSGKVIGPISEGDIGFEAIVDGHVKVFDKAGGAVFGGGDDLVEAWAPKVGEKVRIVKPDHYRVGTKVGDTAEVLNVGEGQWLSILLDHASDGKIEQIAEITDLEPLPVAASVAVEAQPAALKIEAGKFYRTRDGRKVGPVTEEGCLDVYPFRVPGGPYGKVYIRKDGTANLGMSEKESPLWDLIALWQDEPVAVAASNDNAPARPKFKVGDRVVTGSGYTFDGSPGVVVTAGVGEDHDLFYVKIDNHPEAGKKEWAVRTKQLTLIPVTQPTAIVALIENGVPKPAERPFVHATEAAASKEAARLAAKHKGQQFGVYVLASTAKEEAPTYKHEWQRLAANGEKINAIRELRAVTGMQLKPAKDVVEHFIDYPYGAMAA